MNPDETLLTQDTADLDAGLGVRLEHIELQGFPGLGQGGYLRPRGPATVGGKVHPYTIAHPLSCAQACLDTSYLKSVPPLKIFTRGNSLAG